MAKASGLGDTTTAISASFSEDVSASLRYFALHARLRPALQWTWKMWRPIK
jgi:hypothetical protein